MELNAFEIVQNNNLIYITYMSAGQLADLTKVKVDLFKQENEEGYQREILDKHSEEFAKYISYAKGISPLSILINIRDKINFKKETGSFGKLIVPEGSTMWIVDGQHRRKGLEIAINKMKEFSDFQIPVIIMNFKTSYEEAKQFIIINRTQKGVRADLAERFLSRLFDESEEIISQMPSAITRGITWIPKSIEVSEMLNDRKDGPWYNKIRFPNEPKLGTLASQKSFTDSLKSIITNDLFESYTSKEIAEILNRYWSAVRSLCPEAFSVPEDHFIQKTTGIFTLHRLFPLVASFCGDKLNETKIKEVLSKMDRGMNSEYWSEDGEAGLAGTSQKAFGIIYKKLAASLEKGNEHKQRKKRPFEI